MYLTKCVTQSGDKNETLLTNLSNVKEDHSSMQ